jgi:hypothetical protein
MICYDEKFLNCIYDPDIECAVRNKKVWDMFYEPIYRKCIRYNGKKSSKCEYIIKMKNIFLTNRIKNNLKQNS